MRLLYLADIRFPMERANGIQTIETCHALARQGVEVTLAVQRRDDRSDEACLAFYGLEPHPSLRLERISIPSPGELAGRLRFLLGSWNRLRRGGFDALYTRDLILAELVLRLGGRRRRPLFYEAHTLAAVFAEESARLYQGAVAPSARKLSRLDRREAYVCRRAAGIVTITRALAKALGKRHGTPLAGLVAPDGYRGDPPPAIDRHPNGASRFRLTYIGQLYPWKGVDLLLQALPLVEGIELAIVGGLPPEPDLERLKALAKQMRLEDRVDFRGYLPPTELEAERKRADAFVIPLADSTTARLYTSPLKLFEAMGSGRPLLASDLDSIREVVSHERNGLLFEPGSTSALAAGMRRLKTDRALGERIARQALSDVAAFTWDARARAIRDFVAASTRVREEKAKRFRRETENDS